MSAPADGTDAVGSVRPPSEEYRNEQLGRVKTPGGDPFPGAAAAAAAGGGGGGDGKDEDASAASSSQPVDPQLAVRGLCLAPVIGSAQCVAWGRGDGAVGGRGSLLVGHRMLLRVEVGALLRSRPGSWGVLTRVGEGWAGSDVGSDSKKHDGGVGGDPEEWDADLCVPCPTELLLHPSRGGRGDHICTINACHVSPDGRFAVLAGDLGNENPESMALDLEAAGAASMEDADKAPAPENPDGGPRSLRSLKTSDQPGVLWMARHAVGDVPEVSEVLMAPPDVDLAPSLVGVAGSPHRGLVACGGAEHTFEVRHVETGAVRHVLQTSERVRCLALFYRGDALCALSNGEGGDTRLFVLPKTLAAVEGKKEVAKGANGAVLSHTFECNRSCLGLDVSLDGTLLATGYLGDFTHVWPIPDQSEQLQADGSGEPASAAAASAAASASPPLPPPPPPMAGKIVMKKKVSDVSEGDPTVPRTMTESEGVLKLQPSHGNTVWRVCIAEPPLYSDVKGATPGVPQIVSASADQTLRVWDSSTGAMIAELQNGSGWIRDVSFSPDFAAIAAVADDKVNFYGKGAGSLTKAARG